MVWSSQCRESETVANTSTSIWGAAKVLQGGEIFSIKDT